VGANLQNREILPIAKEILEKSSDVPLKSSAIAAIGILRDRSEIPRLEKYKKSSDVRIRSAAAGALKRIKKQNP
jgi:HEAT repeat protein